MADTVIQSVVTLPSTTGLPEDDVQNVFHFPGTDLMDSGDYAVITTALTNFYNATAAGASNEVADWISDSISRGAGLASIKHYATTDFDGSTPFGSPKAEASWTVGASGAATQLPDECAVTLSFHSDLTDVPETQANDTPPPAIIRPAARRRGRIYIGPLVGTTVEELAPVTRVRVAVAVIDTLKFAAKALEDELDATAHPWSVWSKADAELYQIVGGFIDNAFDTQRRRGQRADGRTLWP